jgi:hypothetical protein
MKFRQFSGNGLPAPSVTVLIKGQLLIRPAADGKSCRINVNSNTTSPHQLDVLVDAIFPNDTTRSEVELHGPLEDNFSIEVTPQSHGVFGFVVGNPAVPFDRFSTGNDQQDLRWAIDLQNAREFHQTQQDLVCVSEAEYGIVLKDGVFYTSDRSDPASLFVDRKRASDILRMNRIGTVIGVIIELSDDPHNPEKVLINWKQNGTARTQELPRTGDPDGTYYSISLRNEPKSITTGTTHDELAEYYNVVKKPNGTAFPLNEQFKLEMVQIDSHDGDRIPCMSVFLGE